MPRITDIFESPYTALSVAIILGAIALTGKFNVTLSQVFLVLAWGIAIVGLRSQPLPIMVGTAAIVAGCLIVVGYWFRPDIVAIPQYSGILSPKVETLASKDSLPNRLLEIGDSGAVFVIGGDQSRPFLQ